MVLYRSFTAPTFSLRSKLMVRDTSKNKVGELSGTFLYLATFTYEGEDKASVSKNGLDGKELFTSADNYMLTINENLLRTTVFDRYLYPYFA